jgi:hypothetical protein
VVAFAYFAYRPHAALNHWLAGVQLDMLNVVRANVPATPIATPSRTADAQPPMPTTQPPIAAAPAGALPATAHTSAETMSIGGNDEPANASRAADDSLSADASGPPTQDVATDVGHEAPARSAQADARVGTSSAPRAEPTKSRLTPPDAGYARSARSQRPSRRPDVSAYALPTAPLPSPPSAAERPCTREVVALGLCESPASQ